MIIQIVRDSGSETLYITSVFARNLKFSSCVHLTVIKMFFCIHKQNFNIAMLESVCVAEVSFF